MIANLRIFKEESAVGGGLKASTNQRGLFGGGEGVFASRAHAGLLKLGGINRRREWCGGWRVSLEISTCRCARYKSCNRCQGVKV